MQQDGIRLAKFKEVFKKAVREILKEEDAAIALAATENTRDSFYSDSSVHVRQEEIRALFVTIKQRLSEKFKEVLRQNSLETRLNALDKEIKEGRTCYRNLKDPEYIAEVFDSYVVDRKEDLVKQLEQEEVEGAARIADLQQSIATLTDQLKSMEAANAVAEEQYNQLVADLESACS